MAKKVANVLVRTSKGIAIVKINRPDKLNALNVATLEEVGAAFDKLKKAEGLKGVILTGAGEKAFAAGVDISELNVMSPIEATTQSSKVHLVYRNIERFPVPVIAAVNGFALGGGCELAMACHMRLASDNARFGQPEVKLGLVPGYAGTQRLPQLVGRGRAMELLTTGRMIGAQEAESWGLVNKVYTQKELLPAAKAMVEKLGSMGPLALSSIIDLVDAHYDPARNGHIEEQVQFGELFRTKDFKEGTDAFMNKRKANFKGQ